MAVDAPIKTDELYINLPYGIAILILESYGETDQELKANMKELKKEIKKINENE